MRTQARTSRHSATTFKTFQVTPPPRTVGKYVCAEIIALNSMLQQDPLDAFVLLPQILCITKMAIATDIKGHTHNFANHTHATFRYNDKNGNQTDKNIMHVIHDMALFLTAWCQPSVILAETHCNSVRHLLGELKALISTYDL